jgi:predicted DCC family thiol-disulfide oxidoreductase YuxK
MYSQDYLDSSAMQGELTLALLDWSDEAQEDLVLLAMNGIITPDFEACMRLWAAMRLALASK